jgi:hypothetical protein
MKPAKGVLLHIIIHSNAYLGRGVSQLLPQASELAASNIHLHLRTFPIAHDVSAHPIFGPLETENDKMEFVLFLTITA